MAKHSLLFIVLVVFSTSIAANPQCGIRQEFNAVDLSRPVTEEFLVAIKALGATTILRYYDLERESICKRRTGFCGKTLMPKERDVIFAHGLSIGVVFQHNSGSIKTYYPHSGKGTLHAKRALHLAKQNKQPKGSAIYFATDGADDKFLIAYNKGERYGADKHGLEYITRYFSEVNDVLKDSGYDIGVYGSGLVCEHLTKPARRSTVGLLERHLGGQVPRALGIGIYSK